MRETVIQTDRAAADMPRASGSPVSRRSTPYLTLAPAGSIAHLTIHIPEAPSEASPYRLKLNTFDMTFEEQLREALLTLRFAHPAVRCVIVQSGHPKIFSAGANISMLANLSYGDLIEFCRLSIENRNDIEDASCSSGIKFIAKLHGSAAGGGYELALACDRILMIDDGATTVSLPEVPLLGVLPSTGGLVRLTAKRHIRRDIADLFCTTREGVKAKQALKWGLVDQIARATELDDAAIRAAAVMRPLHDLELGNHGIDLPNMTFSRSSAGFRYRWVSVELHHDRQVATITTEAPSGGSHDVGADWFLAVARELDEAVLRLRKHHQETAVWVMRTKACLETQMAAERALLGGSAHFAKEVLGVWRRLIWRMEASSASLVSVLEPKTAFVGALAEIALASDRLVVVANGPADQNEPRLVFTDVNRRGLQDLSGRTRLSAMPKFAAASSKGYDLLSESEIILAGLSCDYLAHAEWPRALQQYLLDRVRISSDALIAMQSMLRFKEASSVACRSIAGLLVWQSAVLRGGNARGPEGALTLYESGARPTFDRCR